ncbi:MAG TPA: proton-conducting transporter membrane subunit, partial [Casimicrobiaceae bacterium]
ALVGLATAFFSATIGMAQNDIKKVFAYSTVSQLGYMFLGLGAGAFSAGIFHLVTHAFFKALLFLGAGSVIHALGGEQDLRNMGGLRRYMPITYLTMLIGSLALCGIPPFAGFFSKDAIIEATHLSTIPGHSYAYFAVVAGVFVTALYTFRMMFLAFHGTPRFDTTVHDAHAADHGHDDHDAHHGGPPRESPWVVTVPLILLAIPSIYSGWVYIGPMLAGNYFGSSIFVGAEHAGMHEFREEWHGVVAFIEHGVVSLPFWLALAGIATAAFLYLARPTLPARIAAGLGGIYPLLLNNYYFDKFNDWFFAGGARSVGSLFSNVGDRFVIDGIVNGSAKLVGRAAALLRHLQSGYVYHYAFTMIIGLFALMIWWVPR